jgi:hypothetical protein
VVGGGFHLGGAGASVSGYTGVAAVGATAPSKFGFLGVSDQFHGAGFGAKATGTAALVGVGGANSSYTQWASAGGFGGYVTSNTVSTYGVLGAVYNSGTPYNEAYLSTPSYAGDFYGAVKATSFTPFTGAHNALMTPSSCDAGDIVVDVEVISRGGVSDTLTKVALSDTSNQKGVVGVFVEELNKDDEFPSSISVITPTSTDDVLQGNAITILPEYQEVYDAHDLISVNSLGEGQINVCGEGGNLEIGDLIVTSSIAGKGKKQSDDIIRSTTVAKVRENVSFSTYSEVKQVACIYLCG